MHASRPHAFIALPALAVPRPAPETLAVLALVAGALLWGASTVASKALLGPLLPLTIAALRFGLALLVLCPLLARAGLRPATGRSPALLGLSGVFLLNLFQNKPRHRVVDAGG